MVEMVTEADRIYNDLCNFMFPGTSDPDFPGQEWTEVTAGIILLTEDFYNLLVPLLATWSSK